MYVTPLTRAPVLRNFSSVVTKLCVRTTQLVSPPYSQWDADLCLHSLISSLNLFIIRLYPHVLMTTLSASLNSYFPSWYIYSPSWYQSPCSRWTRPQSSIFFSYTRLSISKTSWMAHLCNYVSLDSSFLNMKRKDWAEQFVWAIARALH